VGERKKNFIKKLLVEHQIFRQKKLQIMLREIFEIFHQKNCKKILHLKGEKTKLYF